MMELDGVFHFKKFLRCVNRELYQTEDVALNILQKTAHFGRVVPEGVDGAEMDQIYTRHHIKLETLNKLNFRKAFIDLHPVVDLSPMQFIELAVKRTGLTHIPPCIMEKHGYDWSDIVSAFYHDSLTGVNEDTFRARHGYYLVNVGPRMWLPTTPENYKIGLQTDAQDFIRAANIMAHHQVLPTIVRFTK